MSVTLIPIGLLKNYVKGAERIAVRTKKVRVWKLSLEKLAFPII
jgi:hypothetical protein